MLIWIESMPGERSMLISQNYTKSPEKSTNGFTLVEILVVLGILSFLITSFLIPFERLLCQSTPVSDSLDINAINNFFTQIQEELEQAEKLDGTDTSLAIFLPTKKVCYHWNNQEKPFGLLRTEQSNILSKLKSKKLFSNSLITLDLKGIIFTETSYRMVDMPKLYNSFRTLTTDIQGFYLILDCQRYNAKQGFKLTHSFLLPGY